ncbi:hypothetical protein GGF32_009306 [Allomyces javanicus]|nr:hypothetical protein GGF32_009306 [Allomyces javanicus]
MTGFVVDSTAPLPGNGTGPGAPLFKPIPALVDTTWFIPTTQIHMGGPIRIGNYPDVLITVHWISMLNACASVVASILVIAHCFGFFKTSDTDVPPPPTPFDTYALSDQSLGRAGPGSNPDVKPHYPSGSGTVGHGSVRPDASVATCPTRPKRRSCMDTAHLLMRGDFAARFPVYIAVCEIVFALPHAFEHALLLTTGRFPEHDKCLAFASVLCVSYGVQQLMYGFLALYTYLKVVRNYTIPLGTGDWRLFSTVGVAFGALWLFEIVTSGLGPTGYVCSHDLQKPTGLMLAYIGGFMSTFNTLASSYSYTMIAREVVGAMRMFASVRAARPADYPHVRTLENAMAATAAQNTVLTEHQLILKSLSNLLAASMLSSTPGAIGGWATAIFATCGVVEPITGALYVLAPGGSGWVNGLAYFANMRLKARVAEVRAGSSATRSTSMHGAAPVHGRGSIPGGSGGVHPAAFSPSVVASEPAKQAWVPQEPVSATNRLQ